MQQSIPDEWIGNRAVIHYKSHSFEDRPWDASMVEGVISAKNDLGLIISRDPSTQYAPRTQQLITYDAILTIDVALQSQ